ncbi:MAG TPA: flagellar hook-associated protein FlgK, partial [Alphaproteobacteria bacterium]|nr:flagellar hook-associated protein FlgK [Alphaproteobacteria bacterium]
MSIDGVMRTALSGLTATQSALQKTSNNIANVNTPGYIRQEVIFGTRSVDGSVAGVEIAEVRRLVDNFLNRELVTASGNQGYYDAQKALNDRLQTLLGSPDSPGTLTNLIDQAFDSFSSLAVDPAQMPRRLTALSDLQELTSGIDRLARQIQNLRGDAETSIQSDVDTVNSALSQIYSLNTLIVQQTATGGDTSALQERRSQEIEKIASIMDIRTVDMSDGSVQISTVSGLSLLDKDLRKLVYAPAGQVDTTTAFSAINVYRVDPSTGQTTGSGVALDPYLRAGSLKGLIDMRDKELPQAALSLGELAAKLADQINAEHNNSSAVPPPNSLTGRNVGALTTDPQGFTGKATFAVLDSNNEITSSYTIDFSSAGVVTLQDVINDVNANLTGATLSLSNGVMSLTATSGTDGVAMLQDPADPSSRGGHGFAQFFGMNDLIEARAPSNYDTGLTTTAAHGFGTSGTVDIQFRGPGGIVAASHTLDFSTLGGTVGSVLTDLNTAFSGYATFSLDADGRLTATPASGYEDFDMAVRSDSTTRGSTGVNFSDFFGVGNAARMDAAFSMDVRSDIKADASKLALARLDTSAAAGIPALTEGDNRGATAIFSLAGTSKSFDAAGDLPALQTTMSEYAGYFLSNLGMEADRTTTMS